ncbi:hypothetical protein BGZ58_004595 [Dissophora ornata]|nr:hypothetical protein BGZ58_004595 [Dissophora ornata]
MADETGHDSRPTGSFNLVHEQPVFGTIKDMKTLCCVFDSEDESNLGMDMEVDQKGDRPRIGYLPKSSSPTVLVATSDSGVLSFFTFYCEERDKGSAEQGQFYILKEIEIAEPGFDYSQTGARIAIDPTSRIVAVSALQNYIKLVVIRNTRRSNFDPVERIYPVNLKGTILGMDFLTPDTDDLAILAVLFHRFVKGSPPQHRTSKLKCAIDYNSLAPYITISKETSKYHIATFHIGLRNRTASPLSIQVGTSQLGSNPLKSVLLLKALPNIPRTMVYIDEEKITLVSVGTPAEPGSSNATKHTYHSSLQLLTIESSESSSDSTAALSLGDVFPLISACTTPPRSPYLASDQTLYLGSDTSELYRVNIHHLTYAMQFELVSGERPVGNVMQVLARHLFTAEPLLDLEQEIVLSTDYLVYSSDYGDGGVLAVREEEDGIELFAITELENSSPILDFCAREPSFPGRDSLYVCSGMRGEGSLKRIRSGISVESSGSSGNQFFAGATGLWSAKESDKDIFDSFLIVSFIQSTRLMRSGNEGVVAVDLVAGVQHVWKSDGGVITSAYLMKDGVLVLGQISTGASSLIVLELIQHEASNGQEFAGTSFVVIASKPLKAEPTTIHCWTQSSGAVDVNGDDVLCCVGTLEPAVLVFEIKAGEIRDVYRESMAQAGLESVAIAHSICLLRGQDGRHKIVVGMRDGSIITYDWIKPQVQQNSSNVGGAMSSPRLYRVGILPIKFAFSNDTSFSNALVLSDKLWQAKFDKELEILPILFDSEVSQACSFQSGDVGQSSKTGFVFIVDHQDIQLVTLEGSSKYSHQTLPLGRTPRRILDIASKKLLLIASVGDGFPFSDSTLQLIDPDRVSHDPELEKQHIVAEFALKQGEAVFSLAEWKIPRPNKSDAVYICIGTGIFSPTGSEVSAAAPKTGRLVVLSVKQSKKVDRRFRKFELDLRWTMAMPAPVFAVSTFLDMKLLISNGPVLKLYALDLEKKTLVENAAHRERWPIVQISTSGTMICTGSRRESMCFYEYQPGAEGERDKLQFLKSAPTQRLVSDCIAISPEFAVGSDMSGGIFGLGYSRDDPGCQLTLMERFSFHLGEVVNRIRLAKIWPADVRSLSGFPLSQRAASDKGSGSVTATATDRIEDAPLLKCQQPSSGQMSSWILLPWTEPENLTLSTQLTQSSSSTKAAHVSSQALIACTLIGSILGFWRLQPQVYLILSSLQSVLQTTYECRPMLGNIHDRFRSLSSPGLHTVDGDLLHQFLRVDHALQVEIVSRVIGVERIVEEWLQQIGIGTQERAFLKLIPKTVPATKVEAEMTGGGTRAGVACTMHQRDHVLCRTTNVVCHIVFYLLSLDWHQQ